MSSWKTWGENKEREKIEEKLDKNIAKTERPQKEKTRREIKWLLSDRLQCCSLSWVIPSYQEYYNLGTRFFNFLKLI